MLMWMFRLILAKLNHRGSVAQEQGLKPEYCFAAFSARLKSCPDTEPLYAIKSPHTQKTTDEGPVEVKPCAKSAV